MKTRTVLAVLLAAFIPVMTLAASGKGIAAFKTGRYDQAIKILTPEAESGDAEAQYYLAVALRFSLPKPKGEVRSPPSESDPGQREIHGWFEKAALSGHPEATREYALDFDAGAGVAPDFDLALKWMEKAFDLGDNGARGKLMGWYDSGHIVKPSYQKFRELDAVNAEANAKMREELQQFKKTLEAARVYVEAADAMRSRNDPAAAEQGDPRAARRLAEAATYTKEPVKPDCAAAQRYYMLAGDAGDPRGYRDLGVQFYRGHCQQQDFARARELFTKAAEGADILAIYDLAELNLFGHGQAPDYPAAYYWIRILETLDPSWFRNEPSMYIVAARKMSPAEVTTTEAKIAANAPALVALQKKLNEKVTRRSIKSAGDAASASAWSYDLALLDESGMCSSNVRDNCDYVPFEIQLSIRNPAQTSLDCKLALVMKRPGEESLTYERRYVLFPQDELKPKIGRVAGRVDVPASGVDCKPVTNPSVADKTCAMRLLPGADIEDFLNGSAARRKKQSGRITLELMFEQLKGKPSSVTVKQSSGFAELDEVAIKYAKAASFQTNCVHSPFAMAVGVE